MGVDHCVVWIFCFIKQKTGYEMRMRDWSSDVCSSDLGVKQHCLLGLLKGDIPPLLAMFGIGGGEPVVHEHSRCQGISGVGIGCEHLIYAFARGFQIVDRKSTRLNSSH